MKRKPGRPRKAKADRFEERLYVTMRAAEAAAIRASADGDGMPVAMWLRRASLHYLAALCPGAELPPVRGATNPRPV